MITIRKAEDRGRSNFGWLDSHHTFSFGEYYDPQHMGFRSLRVINDDIVAPGAGFGAHPHHDAEIFSYVIEGELEHKDSMGNGSVIKAGDLQYMSAGNGVVHSEFNPSKKNPAHFLQIWLLPDQKGGKPRYAEKKLGTVAKQNALTLLFAGKSRDDAVEIRQDAEIYFGKLGGGQTSRYELKPNRHAWVHVIEGDVKLKGEELKPGDGAAISGETELPFSATKDSQFLLFDLN